MLIQSGSGRLTFSALPGVFSRLLGRELDAGCSFLMPYRIVCPDLWRVCR